jgi:hypothetical protein
MPKFDVHVYEVVRVKVIGVEADSPEHACEQAKECYDPHNLLLQRSPSDPQIDHVEWAEETTNYLVDPYNDKGKVDVERSQHYDETSNGIVEYEKNPTHSALLKLRDGIVDAVKGGRLAEADIPDDFEWLKVMLKDCKVDLEEMTSE